MRSEKRVLAGFVVLVFAFPLACGATDWKTFDDPTSFLRTEAFASAIKELPPTEKAAAIKRLQESLKSKEVEVRRRAALTLADLGDKSGTPTMIEDLSTATGHDRNNVAVALRILKDERAIPTLRKGLKDKSPYVRGIAAAALGEMKAVKAYDELVTLTKDKEDVDAGKKIEGKLNCIRDCPAYSACYALGALGDERAVPILIELLADADCQGPARQALEVLTKQKLGNDRELWKKWWKDKSQ